MKVEKRESTGDNGIKLKSWNEIPVIAFRGSKEKVE